ncbi:hypothetical protein PB2503_07519 [Parvularcula bermudensis HTCC2503]|uniref:Uncharacterized protein n=1 Tax=Parvularcula bermudensis (strain ATCC BAA-594 / HTCC2503 / KCTC 12087) TaxID=314260 RepID=E0TFW2_PARBH|nr:hypothetical protein [Parvularcula bermudensis]ADM09561.1 hypothetical protein PB2503_07519 [Parvularcula bermudensis HTCC2503]
MLRVLPFLSVLFGSLSIVLLLDYALRVDFVSALEALLTYYDRAITVFLGGLKPLMDALTTTIARWVGVDWTLYPHWRHILVPMWLYVLADTRTTWMMPGRERKVSAIALLLYGGVLSVGASVIGATAPLGAGDLRIVLAPIAALVFFNLIKALWDATFHQYPDSSWLKTFGYYFSSLVATNIAIGLAIFALGHELNEAGLGQLNATLLVAVLILLGIRHLIVAAYVASRWPATGNTWRGRFRRSAHSGLGFAILQVVSGAVAFLVLNAGLSFVGL